MRGKGDRISTAILNLLAEAFEPLETKEIEVLLPQETRIKILYRLNLLRGDGLIRGKAVGSGKGCWIWWSSQQEDGGNKGVSGNKGVGGNKVVRGNKGVFGNNIVGVNKRDGRK